MTRPVRVLAWVIAGAAAIALLAVFGLASNKGTVTGRPAPALPKEALVGAPETLADLRARAGAVPASRRRPRLSASHRLPPAGGGWSGLTGATRFLEQRHS
jgi:hypothetical protein